MNGTDKKQLHQIQSDFLPRKQKYDCYQQIFKSRNSFLKTYPDATFMRMKKGSMRNAQLKLGYNLQIATNNQYVLHYDLFSDQTGTFILMPLLKSSKHLHNLIIDGRCWLWQ